MFHISPILPRLGRPVSRLGKQVVSVLKAGVVAIVLLVPTGGNMAFAESRQQQTQSKHIVLVGASIGRNWHIDQIGQRVPLAGNYRFEYVGVNSFDKSALIRDLESRTEKPDVVLLKECATYFPGDLSAFKNHEKAWVKSLRDVGIQPILVTTAPVAEPTEFVPKLKNWVKKMIGKPTWQDSVLQFNDWLKQYAQSERIPVFDLEAALRRSSDDRWLRAEFDNGDGMHLNKQAYQTVDQAFAEFLATQRIGVAK